MIHSLQATNHRLIYVMLQTILAGIIMWGCAAGGTFPSFPTGRSASQDTSGQNAEFIYGPFRIRIEEAAWRRSINVAEGVPGYSVPQQVPSNLPQIQPDTKFLVLTVSVINTGREPYSMNRGLAFLLENKNGVKYSPSDRVASSAAELSSGGLIGAPVFNPNIPKRYKVVFDIPRDNYLLDLYEITYIRSAANRVVKEIHKWELSDVREE